MEWDAGLLTQTPTPTPKKRYNYKTGAISDDVAAQAEQCMQNIAAALAKAGAAMDHVVRVRYILPDRRDFEKTWCVSFVVVSCILKGPSANYLSKCGTHRPVLQKWLGQVRPAATMIQAGLMEEVMKIEIEVTAKKGGVSGGQETLL